LSADTEPDQPKSSLYQVRWRAWTDRDSIGLRDRHKVDKLSRIAKASIVLFGRDGYDRTTLREIAKEAGVALGTLSLYARDKRDLILLLFNELIPPLLDLGRKNTKTSAALADNIAAYFEPCYYSYAGNVTLFRIILGEIYGGPASLHAEEGGVIRVSLLKDMSDLILRAVASGECAQNVDLDLAAKSFFYLYFAAVRSWLSEDAPKPQEGIVLLRAICQQHITGVGKP
jgi:AcrR family transcriptional regulator